MSADGSLAAIAKLIGRRLEHVVGLSTAAFIVVGCAATPNESNVGQYPAKYKEIVRDHLRKSLFDPYTARDFQIAAPKIGQVHIEGTLTHEPGWTVCYRGNAKNRMGAYTGMKESVLLIRDDLVRGTISDSDHYDVRTNCKDVKYEALTLD